jgi:N-formylglutamate amidohydrolase
MEIFRITEPTTRRVPIVLSIPHCGIGFPDEIKGDYVSELLQAPDDTDWWVDKLYSFAPSLGITVISAVYSRWVIDLNRHPESRPLYSDGRIITALCPVTTFLGEPLYRDKRTAVDEKEVARRTKAYFYPYHQKLRELLDTMKGEFGKVLLWDCHSIRQTVPTIQADKFPDLILGDADQSSAHPMLTAAALKSLGSSNYSLTHNFPFKGGFITRHYGKPQQGVHALQLEMSKINYMDASETLYDSAKAAKMEEVLFNTLRSLSEILFSLKE